MWNCEEVRSVSSLEPACAGIPLPSDQFSMGEEREKSNVMDMANLDDSLDVNRERELRRKNRLYLFICLWWGRIKR